MSEQSEPTGPDLSQGVRLKAIPQGGVLPGQVEGASALLFRDGDHVFAVGGACTHYGGPLAEGLIEGGRVHCPWHQACFDLRSGRALAAPAFADLPRWRVEVVDGVAYVRQPLEATPPKAVAQSDIERIVIVGGGAAGFAAAERLRGLGYAGRLTLLTADAAAPYDRPNLSKDYLAGTAPAEWMPLKDAAWYANQDIDLRLRTTVRAIDVAARTVSLSSGPDLAYDRLLLATGAQPVIMTLPGFDKPQVRTLRSMADADALIALAQAGSRVVVIGAGFIGLEVAAALIGRGLTVHVVALEEAPMERVLGRDLASHVIDLHRGKGVKFHLGRKAGGFDGAAVTLDDGSTLAADLVVVGIGVRPRTELAEAAGLKVDHGVLVDAMFATSAPDIFAAGDIARYPDPMDGAPMRVEHWVAAERQGQIAAANMLGRQIPFEQAPFFWSNHYDLSIHYVGNGAAWDSSRIEGDLAAGEAVVRYFKEGRLVAAATIGNDKLALELAQQLSGIDPIPAWPEGS
ncbi:MAG: pyridine nucleotide-disulfide oxidoreductase [Caulobacteraceae bacterium]|nr:pyridine nucleotide-disulfide oxidoreductase [Caulobacteraceae bacterium]